MADLISREAAIAEVEEYLQELDSCISEPDLKLDGYKNGLQVAIQELKALPAVDAAPVVHGRWDLLITKHPACRWQADASCSQCNHTKYNVWSGFFPDVPSQIARTTTQHYAEKIKLPNYCESCGAKMGGERRDDE